MDYTNNDVTISNSSSNTVTNKIILSEDISPTDEQNQALESNDWQDDLLRKRDRIIPCSVNFEMILKEDSKLSGMIAFNEFANRKIKVKEPPWNSTSKCWSKYDDMQLRSYISKNYEGLRDVSILKDTIEIVARENSFHPVKDYLQSLKWDGTPRADKLFIDTLNVPDDDYARQITRYWLKAAVTRIFNPGYKFDYCLIISGSQGCGKSTVLRCIGREWFNDSLDSFTGKDAIIQLHSGYWIFELSELNATRKSSNETIKSFISKTADVVRLPYGESTEEFPRQCIFAGTTNDPEPLQDMSGGRRFWILKSDAESHDTGKRLSILTDEYINQIWAEVYYDYQEEATSGSVNLLPPQNILNRAEELQIEATEGADLKIQIQDYLDIPIPCKEIWSGYTKEKRRVFIQNKLNKDTIRDFENGEQLRKFVCSSEILYELFNIKDNSKEKKKLKEVSVIMNSLSGWRKCSGSKRMGVYSIQKNVYERVDVNV